MEILKGTIEGNDILRERLYPDSRNSGAWASTNIVCKNGARGPEYVYTVVKTYKEAIKSVLDGSFTEEKKEEWDKKLATVFNRGFWDGYYQGQTLGEWNKNYGSN